MKQVRAEVNELVQIQAVDDPNSRTYHSRVEDASDERISISWPTEAGMRIPFHKKENLFLSFTRQDAVYGFHASVTETIQGPIPMLILHATGEIERIQRRDYVRVISLVPVELSAVMTTPSNSEDSQPNVLSIRTNTINISGGGIAIHHKSPVPLGIIFQLILTLPGHHEPMQLSARVVRNEAREDVNSNRFFLVGLQFLSIPERLRSRIVRHVFDVQKAALARES